MCLLLYFFGSTYKSVCVRPGPHSKILSAPLCFWVHASHAYSHTHSLSLSHTNTHTHTRNAATGVSALRHQQQKRRQPYGGAERAWNSCCAALTLTPLPSPPQKKWVKITVLSKMNILLQFFYNPPIRRVCESGPWVSGRRRVDHQSVGPRWKRDREFLV